MSSDIPGLRRIKSGTAQLFAVVRRRTSGVRGLWVVADPPAPQTDHMTRRDRCAGVSRVAASRDRLYRGCNLAENSSERISKGIRRAALNPDGAIRGQLSEGSFNPGAAVPVPAVRRAARGHEDVVSGSALSHDPIDVFQQRIDGGPAPAAYAKAHWSGPRRRGTSRSARSREVVDRGVDDCCTGASR